MYLIETNRLILGTLGAWYVAKDYYLADLVNRNIPILFKKSFF